MNSNPKSNELRIAPIKRKDAEKAVMRWHYSKTMPKFKMLCFGIWEGDRFLGTVIFGRGVGRNTGKSLGISFTQEQFVELERVALSGAQSCPTSQIVARCMKLLKKMNPGLRLVVSYADPRQSHTGIIYKAMNWIYVGHSGAERSYMLEDGRVMHSRAYNMYKAKGKKPPKYKYKLPPASKFKYYYPLDSEMRSVLEKHRKPYPTEKDLKACKA